MHTFALSSCFCVSVERGTVTLYEKYESELLFKTQHLVVALHSGFIHVMRFDTLHSFIILKKETHLWPSYVIDLSILCLQHEIHQQTPKTLQNSRQEPKPHCHWNDKLVLEWKDRRSALAFSTSYGSQMGTINPTSCFHACQIRVNTSEPAVVNIMMSRVYANVVVFHWQRMLWLFINHFSAVEQRGAPY